VLGHALVLRNDLDGVGGVLDCYSTDATAKLASAAPSAENDMPGTFETIILLVGFAIVGFIVAMIIKMLRR
jgi:hypothetical protein